MQFIKKHYEKVVLSIVLLGLAVAAAALPWQVSHERDRLEEIRRNLTVKVKPKPFKPLDEWLSTNKTALARLESPLNLDFSGPHNLFNPVQWKKMQDGRLVPMKTGSEYGPGALQVRKIIELPLKISFEGVVPSENPNDPPKYQLTIRNEKDRSPHNEQRKFSMSTPHLSGLEILSLQGPTNDPTGIVIRLKGEMEPITVSRDKEFTKPAGYAADMVYTPTKQEYKNKRQGDEIKLGEDPERYKIVAINRNEVVLSADSNKRKWVIKSNASTTTPPTNLNLGQ